jgi:hypothetical protein
MAVTQNTYTGNGSTVLYSFTFPYLETTDIKVSVNGTVVTTYTFANATTIQFNTAPANGAAIRIYRQTDDSALPATFYSGSAIRATDLNDNFTQNLYVTQESSNNASTAITTANSATTTANSALSTANTASTNASAAVATANTASTNASNAVTTANTASTNASNAVTTANAASTTATSAASDAATALSTANTASTNASNAVTTANTASTNASTALSTANTAASNASTALSQSNTALSQSASAVTTANTANTNATAALNAVAGTVQYVLVANVAAIPGTPGNGDAIEIADSTGIESFTPLTNLPAGFVGDSGLSVRLQYLSSGSTWNWLNYFPNNAETRYLKLAGGSITGNLEIGAAGSLTFEGSTANAFETTLAVTDPTADRTITLPNVSGTVVTTGDTGSVTSTMIADSTIVDGDISASAEIAVSKLADGSARQLLQTDAAGTGVEWTSNVDVPGTLDVTSTATFDSIISASAGAAATPSITFTGDTNTGIYSPGADQVAISTNAVERLRIDSNGDLLSGTTGSLGYGGRNIILKSGQGYAGIASLTTESRFFSTWDSSAIPMTFYQGGSERMRLDSSGRLGLGTTGPVNGGATLLTIRQTGGDLSSTTVTRANAQGITVSDPASPTGNYGNGIWFDSGALLAGIASTRITTSNWGTDLRFYTHPTATSNLDNVYERVRIDSEGRVGIGTTSPATRLNVFESTGASLFRLNGLNGYNLDIANNFDSGTRYDFNIGSGSGAFSFTTSAGERARIDSSGRLLVGTSTALGPSTTSTGITLYPNDYSVFSSAGNEPITVNRNNDGAIVSCRRSGVSVGSISVTTTATAFNTSSDYRLKENVVPLIGAVDRLNQLQVHRFNFIADPDKTVDGFIAHEAQAVVPECVTGTKDAVDADGNPVYQGIDQSKLVPLLTAALQEAIGRIETLEAKVAALEGV